MTNSFVYEYEMSTCGIYSTNSHLYKGVTSEEVDSLFKTINIF